MSAREVIASAMPQLGGTMHRDADAILSALTAAGYRILAPGEIDPETREACAKVVGKVRGKDGYAPTPYDVAEAIRALDERKP